MRNLKLFLWMTCVTGILYPLFITFIAQLIMPNQANGSFIEAQGKVIGSLLIGQKFEGDRYFWGRPSAIDYKPFPSGASNLGPTSKELAKQVAERREKILQSTTSRDESIPVDLLFASGSGVDPHISVTAAYYQVERIAKARNVTPEIVRETIDHMKSNGVFEEDYVNVLLLNTALDGY